MLTWGGWFSVSGPMIEIPSFNGMKRMVDCHRLPVCDAAAVLERDQAGDSESQRTGLRMPSGDVCHGVVCGAAGFH